MFVNIFIVEKLEKKIVLVEPELPLKTKIADDKWVICLDAAEDPYQWCREHNYVIYVKPVLREMPDYKYDPEWAIDIVFIGDSLWTYYFREADTLNFF